MKIHAVLSNKQHPEYGVASIPFPIESDDYEHIIELLVPLEIGYISRPPTAKPQNLNMNVDASIRWHNSDGTARRLNDECL